MKPEGALQFGIDTDLSEAAIEEGMRQLKDNSAGHVYCLQVPSQEMSAAVMATRNLEDVYIEINFEYQPYEWSLTRLGFGGPRMTRQTIWSPGA